MEPYHLPVLEIIALWRTILEFEKSRQTLVMF
jgi:hypothetical protein